MSKIFILFILLVSLSLNLWAVEKNDFVVLSKGVSKEFIDKEVVVYKSSVANSSDIKALELKEKFTAVVEDVNGIYILKVGPFKNQDILAIFYLEIREVFSSAFILEAPKVVTLKPTVKIVEKTVVVQDDEQASRDEQTLWIALFGLGAIGIIALFLSSEQIKRLKKEHMKMQTKQDEIKLRQDKMLSDMSENIHTMAKETVDKTTALVEKVGVGEFNGELEKVMDSENKLLDVTSSLIEFLRLKSKKVKIVDENFLLLNLLNDITGTLSTTFNKSDLELVYNVDRNIPQTLLGDTLNLSKILVNILEYGVRNGASHLILSISKSNMITKEQKLSFVIDTDIKVDAQDGEIIFEAKYNDTTQKYENLGLFVAKELSSLMGAELLARNKKDKTLEFSLTLPFNLIKDDKKDISEKLQDSMLNKSVVIVDTDIQSALALQKIFKNLKYKVALETKDSFLLDKIDFYKYDIVVLDDRLLTDKVEKIFEAVKKNQDFKVVLLSNIFTSSVIKEKDKHSYLQLKKPLTREVVLDVIVEIYGSKDVKKVDLTKKVSLKDSTSAYQEDRLPIYRDIFKDTPNVTLKRFSKFRDSKILIVEDNLINQKVLLSVLSKSGIDIKVANNGLEALDIINSDEKFNLILMDINMPIMDGYIATQKIREDSRFDQLPIVSLTALVSRDEVNKMFSSGMNGFLAKPFYKEKLFTIFALFLNKDALIERRKSSQNVAKEKRDIEHKEYINIGLNGLDTQKGISHTSGNSIFYLEVLREFQDAYGNSDKVFERLVHDHRFEQLRMLCLDIKGLSGAIGATDMHNLSVEIMQKIIFKNYEIIPNYINAYKTRLDILNSSIDKYIVSDS